MIKNYLSINKLSAFLIAAFFAGNLANAQCPSNIVVNSTAGQCGAVVSYIAGSGVQSPNGVVNGNATDGFNGWTATTDFDNSWAIIDGYFVSSYSVGTMSQVIDLTTMGLTDDYMDGQPAITVSEDYIGWVVDFADTYSLTVELRGENNNVIATYATGNITTSSTMQTASHVFTGYGIGVRKVYISHTGVDVEYWQGNYGAGVKNVQCTVATPSAEAVQTAGLASGSVFPIGTTTNTFDVTEGDVTTTCSFNVTVNDAQAPVAVVQTDITAVLGEDGTATITPADVDGGSTDNCPNSNLTLSLNISEFTCDDIGNIFVTLTASDGVNSSTATATVHVVDNIAPELLVRNATINLNAQSEAVITRQAVDTGSTDNCGIASFEFSQSTFSCEDLGANDVIVSLTDNYGNVVTQTIVVTLQDTNNYCPLVGLTANTLNNLKVYPNPTTGIITANAGNVNIDRVEVYDINARLLKTFDTASVSGTVTADISSLTTGVYFVKLYSGKNTTTQKVVKQ